MNAQGAPSAVLGTWDVLCRFYLLLLLELLLSLSLLFAAYLLGVLSPDLQ